MYKFQAEDRGCVNIFREYTICIDFNNISKTKYSKFHDFNHFYNSSSNSILFCAVKHREGSDIPNIDCCIFIGSELKMQVRDHLFSVGRVLRTDKQNLKKYGLIARSKS